MVILTRTALVALLASMWAGAAIAQNAPEGQARTVDETSSMVLSPEKQMQVREFLRQYETITKGELKLPKVEQPVSVGSAVPAGIEPVALPQDRVAEVPQVTSYRFFIAGNGIAVVDPETRRVLQVVQGP